MFDPICILILERFNFEAARALSERKWPGKIKFIDSKESHNLSDIEAIFVRTQTKIDSSFLSAFKNLKLIVTLTSGFDHLPLKLIRESGLTCFYCPESHVQSVAELTISFMLLARRKLAQIQAKMAHRGWRDKELKAHLLSQARLGILGLGRIGKRVFSLAKAFGAKVEYYDPFVKLTDEERISFGDSVNHLETLLSRSELVSLHLPLTPLTDKLVGTSFLANCNPNGLILINTSRGSVIDEPALKKILDDRESYPSKLELVALDVFPEEPLPPNSWFRTHPKVIATPHIGAFTKEAEEASSLEATEIAIKFFQTLSLHASKTPKKEGLKDLEPVPWFGNLPLKEAWFVEAFGEQHQKLLGF